MSKRLLFVDDDRRFREVVMTFLQGRGFEIIQAGSGTEAETELEIGRFDLLIVDGQLPDFDGATLIRKMRERGDQTKVIFVSGAWKDTESYRALSEELKVERILHKPVPPAVLADHIERLMGAALVSAKEDKVRSALEQMSARFAADMPEMILDLTRDIRFALAGKEKSVLHDASRKAHMLKGSSGSYGFMSMSHAMEKLEEFIDQLSQGIDKFEDPKLTEGVVKHLSETKSLADHIARSRGKLTEKNDENSVPVNQILLMARDPGILQMFESFVSKRDDTAVVLCSDRDDALKSATISVFDLVFLEVSEKEMGAAGEICLSLRSLTGYSDVPILCISGEEIPDAEEKCHYYGVVEIIRRPLNPEKIMNSINELVITRRESFPKIVMFDDDPNFVRRVEISLNCEGLNVVGFTDTAQVDSVLSHAEPSLVLLDVDMPGMSGFDVCRQIRANRALRDLPVVMVTAMQNWETRLAAYESGADDYLSKPVVNAELIVKCRAWIERYRRRTGHEDTITQLPVHSVFQKQVQALLEREPSCAFVLFRIDNLHSINEAQGSRVGDKLLASLASLLRRRFRTNSVKGRWSGSALGMAVKYSDKRSFEKAVQRFVEDFKKNNDENSPDVSARVSYSDGGKNVYSLAKAMGTAASSKL